MRHYKSSGFYVTIINILYILNIKYLNGAPITCEQCTFKSNGKCESESGELCPSYCRPHFYEGKCYDCSSVLKNNASPLYSIDENECIPPITNYDRIIISETNEVVKNDEALNKTKNDTLDIKEFGGFIYKTCPRYTEATQFNGYKRCKCTDTTNSFLYPDKIFDVTHYRCVNSCPQGYNFYFISYDNYICSKLENAPHQHIRPNNTLTENCDSEQPYIVKYVQIGTTNFYYCLNKCPESLPFFKNDPAKPNEKECLDKCPENYFYYKDTKECIQNCANYQSWIDIKTKTFICARPSSNAESNIDSDCPAEFPYKYGSSCLRNCSDTNDAFFSLSSSHFGPHYDRRKKMCNRL